MPDHDDAVSRTLLADIKQATGAIRLDCDFQNNGCRAARSVGGLDLGTKNIPCCCGHCHREWGYLRAINMDELHFPYLADYWSVKTGFWRKGKGCILPRRLRSSTCVFYACYDTMEHMKNGATVVNVEYEKLQVLSSLYWMAIRLPQFSAFVASVMQSLVHISNQSKAAIWIGPDVDYRALRQELYRILNALYASLRERHVR